MSRIQFLGPLCLCIWLCFQIVSPQQYTQKIQELPNWLNWAKKAWLKEWFGLILVLVLVLVLFSHTSLCFYLLLIFCSWQLGPGAVGTSGANAAPPLLWVSLHPGHLGDSYCWAQDCTSALCYQDCAFNRELITLYRDIYNTPPTESLYQSFTKYNLNTIITLVQSHVRYHSNVPIISKHDEILAKIYLSKHLSHMVLFRSQKNIPQWHSCSSIRPFDGTISNVCRQ